MSEDRREATALKKKKSTSAAPSRDEWAEAKRWVREQGLEPCSSSFAGRGSFGTVWPARSCHTQLIAAVKFSRSFDEEDQEQEKATLRLLSKHPHPNIAHILAYQAWGGPVWMCAQISELAFSDLQTWLRRRVVDVPTAIFLARDLASGLSHIHSLDIEHRDLKPSNLLLHLVTVSTTRVQLRIGDFGSARPCPSIWTASSRRSRSPSVVAVLHKFQKRFFLYDSYTSKLIRTRISMIFNTYLGTSSQTTTTHRAPEVWSQSIKKGREYDRSADIWSLGCVPGSLQP